MARIKKAPIKFAPYFKSVIWGGNKICEYKSIPQKEDHIGESWEISAIQGHESVAIDGEYAGNKLTELVTLFGEDLLGGKVIEKYGMNFPLLIKFIDAHDDLSVQVHPDDKLARERHDSFGKTELWYIIQAEKGAKIIAGFNRKMSREELKKSVEENTLLHALEVHESFPGKVFFLPAGQVHSIGAGNLLVEIQQSSDITYRIYDYDRKDDSGQLRELHCDLATDAVDYELHEDYKLTVDSGKKVEKLVECEHFTTNKIDVDKEMDFNTDYPSFTVVVCVDGKVDVQTEEGSASLKAGESALLPSVVSNIHLTGQGRLLVVNV